MIKIIACLKVIIDPDAPFSIFKVDRETMKPIPPQGMPPVINPFDENALEAALKIKDKQDCQITVISMGNRLPKAILQRALAVGADKIIALEDPEFEDLDPFNTAQVLVNGINKIGEFDLVFTGRQAGDWDAGLVWAGIAELLDIPSITLARKAEVKDGKAIVERVAADGIEILEADMPVLINFSNEVGELRYFSIPSLMKAKKKEITKWSGSDIQLEPLKVMEVGDLYIPDLGFVDCEFIEGDSPVEKGQKLAKKILEEEIIIKKT